MFGFKRKRRFERAVADEMAYMLDLHGAPETAAEAASARAQRPNLPASRIKVLQTASARLRAQG